MTQNGGAASCGTIYSVDPASGKETTLYSFAGEAACHPFVAPVFVDGKIYGGTSGDRYEKGVFYGFDPAARTTTVLRDFAKGKSLTASLIAVGKRLYGVAGQSYYGSGLLISIDANTGRAETLYDFTGGADGYVPISPLVHVDGAFYGTSTSELNAALVFKFVP